MKKLPILIAILIITLLSACNSTPKVVIVKKPLISDHYLMLSLLNREITQDHQMMLAFAAHRASYQSPYFVNAVDIKGPKNNEFNGEYKTRPTHRYSKLIAQDFNSVQISGPN